MTWIYTYETRVIELALERLREDGIVWQDATVNDDAPQDLRREVPDREVNLLSRLSRIAEVEPVRSLLAWLKGEGAIRLGLRCQTTMRSDQVWRKNSDGS